MWRVALKGLLAHKRRLIGTCSAVVIGVAFLAGTLVLSDTMRASFDNIFTNVYAGTDALVQSAAPTGGRGPNSVAQLIPESLVGTLQQVPQVQAAAPVIQGVGQLVGSDGKPLGGEGPPTLASNWIDNAALNPYKIAQGAPPRQDLEVVINKGAAETGQLTLGQSVILRTPDPVKFKIVGIATFGDANGLGGATFAGLTFADAQKYFGFPGKVNTISVQAKPDVDQTQLVSAITPVLPDGVKAVTGTQQTADVNAQINDGFLGFFKIFLLVFAGIALIVATFSIYNTFAVIVAQRTRESALLRAIGASRGQVMRALTFESLIIGVIASVVGLGAGVALAAGLKALLDVVGFGLPAGGLVVSPGSVMVALVVGLLVTILASLIPAIRASRVAPLAALRDVSVDKSNTSGVRIGLGVFTIFIGTLFVASMALNSNYLVLERAGIGAALTFVGFLIFAPVAAIPIVTVIGTPISWLRGTSGRMATRNAKRNPRRTANTSAALVVAVCVVTLFTIFAASIKASIDDSVAGSFTGELVMSSTGFSGAGFSPKMVAEMNALPEVGDAASFGLGEVLADGEALTTTVTDFRRLGPVLNLPTRGEPLNELTSTQIAISQDKASEKSWAVGTSLVVVFADAQMARVTVGSIYQGQQIVSGTMMSTLLYDRHTKQPGVYTVLISLAPGVSLADGQGAVQAVANTYSAGNVQTRSEYITSSAGQIDTLLNVVYVLLFLTIVIAVTGITNTLSLSIYERTRELGLLRAVGMTRSQTRSMVRWESVIIALFGTLVGLALGSVLGWALMKAVAAQEDVARFAMPTSQLVLVGVVGGLIGILAGIRPARRAAKLNILAAIASE